MPPVRLDHLETFALIVRSGGFRAAATERGVSSSVMSQTMTTLEQALGLRLLNRTTRSIAPTEAGARLLDRLGPALDDIRLALVELDQLRETPSGTLRINAPGPAVDHVLCPLAFAFMETYPEVRVEIVSDAAIVDIVSQGFDAGVRFGRQLAEDMIAVPLGPPLRYAIVASPDYLRDRGRPETPGDLIGHNCIRRRYPGLTRPYRTPAPAVVGWLAVATTAFFILLYMPGSPSALVWPEEWAIVLVWVGLGAVLALGMRRRVAALGVRRQARLILGDYVKDLGL